MHALFYPVMDWPSRPLPLLFPRLVRGFQSLRVDAGTLVDRKLAVRLQAEGRKYSEFVNCGRPLPGHTVKVVDDAGQELADLRVGSVLVHGSSIMTGIL